MNITTREKQVLDLISSGHTIKEIALKLYISPHTAVSHKKNLFEKLKAQNAPALVRAGFKHGILQFMLILLSCTVGVAQHQTEIEGDVSIEGKISIEKFTGNTLTGKNSTLNITANAAYNTIYGYEAGRELTKGDNNVLLGYWSGLICEGSGNVYLGSQSGKMNDAGFQNTLVGNSSGLESKGHHLTLIGANSKTTSNTINSSIAIGYNAEVACNDCAVIGGTGNNAVDVGIGLTTPSAPMHVKTKLAGVLNPVAIFIEDLEDSETWELTSFLDQLSIERNGNPVASVDPTTGAYTQLSDRRLKENFTPFTLVLSQLSQLQAYSYNYKRNDQKEKTIGFIAQDVQEVFPELVSSTGEYLSINYSGFGPVAIEAIKELNAIINSLQKQNDQLTDRITTIEKTIHQYAQTK